MPCDSTCKTCTGTLSDECDSCHTGMYLTDTLECLPCDITCLDCNGPDSDECTYCQPNAVFVSGVCRCLDGFGRHPTSQSCVLRCPSGFSIDHLTRMCVADSPAGPLPLNWLEGDHPPMDIPDYGGYFDGNASLKISDFEVYREH